MCNDAFLWETVHSFLDQDIDESIGSGEFVKFVECNDVVWNVRKLESHVFWANHWCGEVEILDVDGHESCPFGGDNTVEENLGGQHVSCWCAAIARVCDSVTTHCKTDAVRVFLLRSVVGADASVGDIFFGDTEGFGCVQ